jgi:hypothetical protein
MLSTTTFTTVMGRSSVQLRDLHAELSLKVRTMKWFHLIYSRGQHPVGAGQHYEADDLDGLDNDTPALPVLQRRSVDSMPPPLAPPPTALPSRHRYIPKSPIDINMIQITMDRSRLFVLAYCRSFNTTNACVSTSYTSTLCSFCS